VNDYAPLLGILVALLVGLAAGKAWERYKLRNGRWLDRRKLRDSPHFLQGLNFLAANQVDLALEEISQAAAVNDRALEIHIILGNLYREKGQVGRAVQIHQQLLQRPRLSRLEQSSVLLSLGLDYKQGGFVDRAIEAFQEVIRLEPGNIQALFNLEKLHEDQHQWSQAYEVRQRLAALAPDGQRRQHQTILAFLENELGLEALKAGNPEEAARRYGAAIELDASVAPAYLNLGDVTLGSEGAARAVEVWERLLDVAPDRAFLALDRLAGAYVSLGQPDRFEALCRRIISSSAHDWRARLALSRHLSARGALREALAVVLEALAINPHAITLHEAAWRILSDLHLDAALVGRYVEVSRDAVFYHDPHVCLRCHYRSTELLWQCPHCHEWNSFVEERLTPAREDPDAPSPRIT